MRHLFKYYDPIHDFPVYVLFNATPDKLRRMIRMVWDVDPEQPESFGGRALLLRRGSTDCYELLVAFRHERPSYATVAHEAFHLTEFTMNCIGCRHSSESSEPWAYLLGYHVKKISQIIDEHFVTG